MTVSRRQKLSKGIDEFILVPSDGVPLPAFTAGSHINLELGQGLIRSYSLSGSPGTNSHYRIAVQREEAGRGGSRILHDAFPVGTQLLISQPNNAFWLHESAHPPLFIAGGIGITPIMSMIHHLEQQAQAYALIYLTQSPERTAYADVLNDPARLGDIKIHHDFGDTARMFDIAKTLDTRSQDSNVYCCGPEGLMAAVRNATQHRPVNTVHFESFGASSVPDNANEFEVEIASTGQVIGVPADQSILEALTNAGMDLDSSCEAGTCGTCQVGYLSGDVTHEDFVLLDDERETQMMICVSRAKSARLKLDL